MRQGFPQGEFTSPEDVLSSLGALHGSAVWGMDLLAKFGQATGSTEADDKLLLS